MILTIFILCIWFLFQTKEIQTLEKERDLIKKFVVFYKKYPSHGELEAYKVREKETLEKLQDDLATRA